MSDLVTMLAVIIAAAAVAVAVWALARSPRTGPGTTEEPEPDGDGPVLVARPGPVAGELELWADGVDHPVARVRSLRPDAPGRPSLSTPLVSTALTALIRAGRPVSADISGRYLVSLSPGSLAGMAPTAGSGSVVQLSRLVPGVGVAPSPLTVLAAGAAVVSLVQQQHLARSISQLDRKISAVMTRLRHDDHGALAAAGELLELVMASAARGDVPEQLRLELAQTRVRINSLHHARRKSVDDFVDVIGPDTGALAPAAAVAEAIGDADEFQQDMLLYLDSVLVRGRLATITALVVAADGHGGEAQRLLEETASSTRQDFYQLALPLKALAARSRDAGRIRALTARHRRLAAIVEDLEAVALEIEPSLPPEATAHVELVADVADGEVRSIELPAPDGPTPATESD